MKFLMDRYYKTSFKVNGVLSVNTDKDVDITESLMVNITVPWNNLYITVSYLHT